MWLNPCQRRFIHDSVNLLCLLQALHSLRTLIFTCFLIRWLGILNISPGNFYIIIQAFFRKIFSLTLSYIHSLIIWKRYLLSLFLNMYLMVTRFQSQKISFIISLNLKSSPSVLNLIKCFNIIHNPFGSFFICYSFRHGFIIKIVMHSRRRRDSQLRLRLACSENFVRMYAIHWSLGTSNFYFESFYFLCLDFFVSSFDYF